MWTQAPASGVRPGTLQGMNTAPLQQVLAGRAGFTGLPADAGGTMVVSCKYAPARAGTPAVERIYWYEYQPEWVSAVAPAHPIHRLVRGAAVVCPPAFSGGGATAAAPVSTPAAAPAAPPEPPVSAVFTAKGLENEPTFNGLYSGQFTKIELERESPMFSALFASYLNSYGAQCDRYLPANKVEIMRSECAREQYTVNGYGARVGGSTCIEYRQVGTGIYADPVLYRAKLNLERQAAPESIRQVFAMATRGDAIGNALNMAGNMKVLQQDLVSLVGMNGCTSPALRQFAANLIAYSESRPGIQAAGFAAAAAPKAPEGPFRDSNYTRLLEDLVTEQSKTWAMNRFQPGSVSGVSVVSRDSAGRPAQITGQYIFSGFSGRSRGSVKVEFVDGSPECLYFFDFPTTCRKASRRVGSAYAEGAYR